MKHRQRSSIRAGNGGWAQAFQVSVLKVCQVNNNNNNLLLIQRKYLYEYIQMCLTSYIKIILK